ncbi:MAG TPA: nucleoside triphosphate pyrophosphatase [Acidocella sp.]|nr:MAG: septum formation protein Maf [Acidocella sp. 20-61-6]HQT47139.1 nucleoside triphosphate pyrophosphatase [Acidocella sp.]
MPLILASASPARQSLLRQAGLTCRAVPAAVDEAALKRDFAGDAPSLAQHLAAAKAAEVAARNPHALVIGADQLLVCDGESFDKPESLAHAAVQLRRLSGRKHHLITAVCVYQGAQELWSNLAQAKLTLRPLSDDFIAHYLSLEGEAILGCVGAYRLEGLGAQLFTQLEGDFFTILGLNLLPLLGYLRATGVLAS